MTAAPTFVSIQEYASLLGDVGFWQPYLAGILERHDLAGSQAEPEAGVGGTYPTFLCGDVVVKLFGFARSWRKSYAAERAVLGVLATDLEIAAPRLLAEGRLHDDPNALWPYMITKRMPGVAWQNAELSNEQRLSVAEDLGRQVKRVHALSPFGIARHEDWPITDVAAAVEQSSLPSHLTAQVDDYLARLGPFDRVFVHGDIMFRHVFVENGRLAGLIDWGDAMVTDRHYEFAKLHLDLFDCDKLLLRAFLEASDWPVTKDFAQKAMGLALYRQAHGLAQHHTMDVFYKLPALVPMQDIGSLDELATELFAV